MALAPGVRFGPYLVIVPIGRGGMGEVYRARDTRLDRDVALKVLPADISSDRERRERLKREARILAALNHPGIVTIYSVEHVSRQLVLAMELVDGMPLSAAITPQGLPVPRVLAIAAALADALACAHEHGVIHRDLKPANIIFTAHDRVKVLDFGLATLRRERATNATTLARSNGALTREGMVLGTVDYMAPEQAEGRTADARSDIFSLGVVMYEMAAGVRPFTGPNPYAVLSAILGDRPIPVSQRRREVPAGLETVIHRCLEKDAGSRFQSATDVRRALEDLREEVPRFHASNAAPAGSDSHRHRVSRTRLPVAVVLTAVFVIAVLAAGLPAWLRGRFAPSPAITSLAVLPIENLSGDPGEDYVAEGMTESLITDLARIRPLRVVSRTSVIRYAHSRKSIPEIARELNVDAIIEGSIQAAGSRVRVRADLIRAATDQQVWGDQYDRDQRDILQLEDDVATSIARQIRATVAPGGNGRRVVRAHAVDPDAYLLYIKGRYFLNKRTRQALDEARSYFRQAIDRDPAYAAPYSGLADAEMMAADFGRVSQGEAMARARAAAARAIALDPALGEPHASLAFIEFNADWNFAASEAEFRRALALNPDDANAHHWYAHLLVATARYAEAEHESRRALELDPLNPIVTMHLAWHFYQARRYDDAIRQVAKGFDLDPGFPMGYWFRGMAYEQKGMHREAIDDLRRARDLLPGNAIVTASLGRAYATAGKREAARQVIADLAAASRNSYASPCDPALVEAALGNTDRAFELLRKALREHSEQLVYLDVDPAWDSLRHDPRFAQLTRSIGLQRH